MRGKFVWISDSDNTLGTPHFALEAGVHSGILSALEDFPLVFIPASGKPAYYLAEIYYRELIESAAEDVRSRIVISGSDGAETWLGINPDLTPAQAVFYDVSGNGAEEAIARLNAVTEFLLESFGPLVKEQINAEIGPGQRLKGSIALATNDTGSMRVRHKGAVEKGVHHTLEELGVQVMPSMQEIYQKGIAHIKEEYGDSPLVRLALHHDFLDILPEISNQKAARLDKTYPVGIVAENLGIKPIPIADAGYLAAGMGNPRLPWDKYREGRRNRVFPWIASGDYINDKEMFEMCAFGVCPSGSHEEILRRATHVVGGLAHGFPHTGQAIAARVREILGYLSQNPRRA